MTRVPLAKQFATGLVLLAAIGSAVPVDAVIECVCCSSEAEGSCAANPSGCCCQGVATAAAEKSCCGVRPAGSAEDQSCPCNGDCGCARPADPVLCQVVKPPSVDDGESHADVELFVGDKSMSPVPNTLASDYRMLRAKSPPPAAQSLLCVWIL